MMDCGHDWSVLVWDQDTKKEVCGACRQEVPAALTAARLREALEATDTESAFKAGEAAAQAGDALPAWEDREHWWGRGYAHASRLRRALEAEAEAARLRDALDACTRALVDAESEVRAGAALLARATDRINDLESDVARLREALDACTRALVDHGTHGPACPRLQSMGDCDCDDCDVCRACTCGLDAAIMDAEAAQGGAGPWEEQE